MVKLMIVTHGPMADAMKESAAMFFGDVNDIETIGLFPNDSLEELQNKINNAIKRIDDGDGSLIFVDIFGGSPFNAAALTLSELKESYKLQCIAGVNMPLLMEAFSMRSFMTLDELVSHLESVAESTISNVRTKLDL
jgi:PTS system mannose-specific IIA component